MPKPGSPKAVVAMLTLFVQESPAAVATIELSGGDWVTQAPQANELENPTVKSAEYLKNVFMVNFQSCIFKDLGGK